MKTFVCPVCFRQEQADKGALCGDCGSEAVDSRTVPLDELLRDLSLERLQKLLQDWIAAVGNYQPAYHRLKYKRLLRLLRMKRTLGGLPPVEKRSAEPPSRPDPGLLRSLSSPDAGIRKTAVESFLGRPKEDQRWILNWATADGALTRHRRRLIEALGVHPAEATRVILESGMEFATVWRLYECVQSWGRPALEVLLKSLEHAEPSVRRRALDFVCQIDSPGPEIAEALLTSLKGDEDASVRAAAATALGPAAGEDPRIALELLDCLKDPDQNVRTNAMNRLGNVRPIHAVVLEKIVDELTQTSLEGHRSLLLSVLVQVGPSAAPALPALEQLLAKPLGTESIDLALLFIQIQRSLGGAGADEMFAAFESKKKEATA